MLVPDPPCVDVPDQTIPLFVDFGVETIVNGVFRSLLTPGCYSHFPILVRTKSRPNDYFTLTLPHSPYFWAQLDIGLGNARVLNLAEFTPQPSAEKTVWKLSDTTNIYVIIKEVLNPLGIGAFHPTQEEFAEMPDIFPRQIRVPRGPSLPQYFQGPYAMSMVKEMFYEYGQVDDDFSPLDVACFLCLKYPINPIMLPRPNLRKLRDRYIFFYQMLRNPPGFDVTIATVTKEVNGPSTEIMDVDPCQWILVACSENHGGSVVIANSPDAPLLSIFNSYDQSPFPDDYAVQKSFVNQKTSIMSPKRGKLWYIVDPPKRCIVRVYSCLPRSTP
jgi:hypothetical protein